MLNESAKAKQEFLDSTQYMFIRDASALLHPDDRKLYFTSFSFDHLMELYRNDIHEFKHQYRIQNQESQWKWVEATVHIIKEAETGEIKATAYIKDIDQQKKDHSALIIKAEGDAMTWLYNRITVQEKIDALLKHPYTTDQHTFLIFDIDYFKLVNDTLGHQSGDLLLKTIADTLTSQCRSTDILGRLGGDEFVIFLRDIPNKTFVGQKTATILNHIQTIPQQLSWTLPVTISMGIALFPKDGHTFETLYEKADHALYKAKREGRNRFEIYNAEGTWE